MGTVKKGRRSELLMMAMLIENGFSVFEPLADEEGVDCGVLAKDNVLIPIQIKSRAEFSEGDLVSIDTFPKELFVIIYDESTKNYWIIPCDDYRNLATPMKDGVTYRLTIKKRQSGHLDQYKNKNGIEILKNKCMSSAP